MSIYATIYNKDFEPLTDAEILDDDSGFYAIEAKSMNYAIKGHTCCIRWSRDSDGQIAYWGPKGAISCPHWYSKPNPRPGTAKPETRK